MVAASVSCDRRGAELLVVEFDLVFLVDLWVVVVGRGSVMVLGVLCHGVFDFFCDTHPFWGNRCFCM